MNWHGEVIGINTMILSNSNQSAGIGFAIPINTAKAVLNDLMTLGRVKRPALGVRTVPVSPELADEIGLPVDFGLLIIGVVPGSSADQAGLRAGTERAYLGNIPIMLGGDLIVAIDGEKIQDQDDLTQMMNNHRAGDSVKVTIYRGKKKMDVEVSLGEARQQVVNVLAGQQVKVMAQLTPPAPPTPIAPPAASLKVLSATPLADVYLDGDPKGPANSEIKDVRPGAHIVEVRPDGSLGGAD